MLMFLLFFKQKTAYEKGISDWSSDVCSSDLRRGIDLIERAFGPRILLDGVEKAVAHRLDARGVVGVADTAARIGGLWRSRALRHRLQLAGTAEEGRGGEDCVRRG